MRTLPPIDLDIPVQPAWTWLVDVLAGLALTTLVGWWFAAVSAPAEPWRTACLAIGVLLVVLALHARRMRRCRLRWDGQQWFWAPATRHDDLPLVAGRMSVMLDLQSAMLLRFEPDGTGRSSSCWIAVHRRGLGADWHPLRCAVFSRQAVGAPKTTDDTPLEARQ